VSRVVKTWPLGVRLDAPPFPTIADDDRLEYYGLGKGPLFLRRLAAGHEGKPRARGKPVLMIHGGSASCDTFLAPHGESVFDFLVGHGLDVWLLDWRGSFHVVAHDSTFANETGDVAAADLALALRFIRQVRAEEKSPDMPASVVAHCLGGACFAMAVGSGLIQAAENVDKIVFATIGLFYQVTWDGWTKVMDRLLERLPDQAPDVDHVSPAEPPWPAVLEDVYQLWPKTWGPPWRGPDDDFFQRLAFMYGQPFLVGNLHEKIGKTEIRKQFGGIPLELYRHAAQNALRGFAAECDPMGKLDPATPNDEIPTVLAKKYMNLGAFEPFQITLLTGELNPLWHRDSIDLMAEWLSRDPKIVFRKHVLDGYGHQDLWWGKNSPTDVFRRVLTAVW
jgi:pimeloyl-ACP methyl ester carboxylesterase